MNKDSDGIVLAAARVANGRMKHYIAWNAVLGVLFLLTLPLVNAMGKAYGPQYERDRLGPPVASFVVPVSEYIPARRELIAFPLMVKTREECRIKVLKAFVNMADGSRRDVNYNVRDQPILWSRPAAPEAQWLGTWILSGVPAGATSYSFYTEHMCYMPWPHKSTFGPFPLENRGEWSGSALNLNINPRAPSDDKNN